MLQQKENFQILDNLFIRKREKLHVIVYIFQNILFLFLMLYVHLLLEKLK